ncbi:hypothetical protein CBL31_26600, partial [Shigella flexneri]
QSMTELERHLLNERVMQLSQQVQHLSEQTERLSSYTARTGDKRGTADTGARTCVIPGTGASAGNDRNGHWMALRWDGESETG